MPKLAPISLERHADQRWRRFTSYAFAARTSVAPVVLSEMPKASMAMPLAFIREGEAFLLVALMGLAPGKNLFVAPDGRWLGRYVPAALRGHPFALGKLPDDQFALCVDEDSEWFGGNSEGEPLLTEEGEPTEAVSQVLEFLKQVESNRSPTAVACAALARHEVIRPWSITLKSESGERPIEGLYRIDESELNKLKDEAFLDLRRSGAMTVAYCQLLSAQHLSLLGDLSKAHEQGGTAQPVAPATFALQGDDILRFD
ncbi:SapC family protein [Imhoffiella purpurea]|uniref:SAPC family protein n=1 Tax=Imhoffiella purpurea TaxID=1249627 RepID=W9W039_9GAMM|nr:SapC family protein [Imhoffiella purpurea]EXJ15995.1 SAPC family protein [Imhoffiella purpurea]